MENFVYKAPGIRLDVNQFANVEVLSSSWEVFPSAFRPGEKESRVPVKILEGQDTGETKTIRTRSDDLIFKTIELAGKTDIRGLKFWIKKIQKTNSKGNVYNTYEISRDKPL